MAQGAVPLRHPITPPLRQIGFAVGGEPGLHLAAHLAMPVSGDTLASWLKQHGRQVTTMSRDRSGAYADGICAGAPKAVQVADRWRVT